MAYVNSVGANPTGGEEERVSIVRSELRRWITVADQSSLVQVMKIMMIVRLQDGGIHQVRF